MAGKGRPVGSKGTKAKMFGDALRLEVNELIDKADTSSTKLRKIAKQLVSNAMDGDNAAIKEVADRLDGKPSQANEHTIEPSDALSALLEAIDGRSRSNRLIDVTPAD